MKTNAYLFCMRSGLVLFCGLGLSLTCMAQAPVASPGTSFSTSLTLPMPGPASVLMPGAAVVPEAVASAPAPAASGVTPAVPLTAAPTTPSGLVAPVLLGCRPVSDKAMAIDMAAVTAQSKKADLAEQAKLFSEAVALWSLAMQQCDGRARERAARSRDDDQHVLDQITEAQGAGPQCASGQKDAAALQDLAKQALTERRWSDAASLFRKAENMWDFAAERCTGSQQEVANRRRDQSVQDGHNAEFCAPLFELAREHTQKLRSAAAGQSREEKQDASMVAETLWRDALEGCKGAAVQDIASNNAKALARERGTPWVPRLPPAGPPAVANVARPALGSLAGAKPIGTGAALSLVQPVLPAVGQVLNAANAAPDAASTAAALASPRQTTATSAAKLVAQPTPLAPSATETRALLEPAAQMPGVMMAGTTRFTGQFARDADATTISGTGKVAWATGDVFEGTLVMGLRQGQGSIAWANGQRYTGEWVKDKPTGQAKMHFANGNDYEGRVIDGMPQGVGHMRYASGDVFDGVFKNGEPHERGVYVWRNGQVFDGTWVNGRPNGQGKLKFATGNQFEGTVAEGVPQGQGRMVFSGGEVYTGQFLAGEPDGEGTFIWPSGDQYTGQWKAGKKHGKGAFTWKAGDRWEGIYENDVQKN